MLLDSINGPDDLRELSYEELDVLSAEIRELIVTAVSKNAGHLAQTLVRSS